MKINQLKEAKDLLWELEKLEIFWRYVEARSGCALHLTMGDQVPCFILSQGMSRDILNAIEKDINNKMDELGIERDG